MRASVQTRAPVIPMKKWFQHIRRVWGASYWKRIMTFLVVNAVLWIWVSYYLATRGMNQIASNLSETALKTILGTVIAYAVKSTTENISKNGFVGKIGNEYEGPEDKPKNEDDYHEI